MGALDSTLGCMLLATAMNTWFFGLVSYQYGVYVRTRYNDRLLLKATVFSLCCLDCAHSALAIFTTYTYLVNGFANIAILSDALWSIPAVVLFINASSAITHVFFFWRIFRLTRNVYLLGALLFMQTATSAMGLVTGVRALQVGVFSGYQEVSNILTAWLTMQAFVDILITVLLIWIFRVSRTAFAPTNAVLNRLIRGALQTGVISSLFSLGYLLGFVLAPDRLIWMVFGYCLGRIYSITLMDTLICRTELKEKLNGPRGSDERHGGGNAFQLQPSSSQGVIRIHTQVQKETDVDPTQLDRKYAVDEESDGSYHSRALAV